jgi:hypothetical protein
MNPTKIADLIEAAYPAGSVECAWEVLRILNTRRHGQGARLSCERAPSASTWRQALRLVCLHYDVLEADVLGDRRFARLSQARFALQVVMVERLGLKAEEVARLTRRDGSSVRNALRSLQRNTAQWRSLSAALDSAAAQGHAEAAE